MYLLAEDNYKEVYKINTVWNNSMEALFKLLRIWKRGNNTTDEKEKKSICLF